MVDVTTMIQPGFGVVPHGLLVRGMDGHNFKLEEPLPLLLPDGSTVTGLQGSSLSRLFSHDAPQTDGASTPSVFWSLGLPPFGWYWLAVVMHDLLYRMMTRPIIPTRDECDTILRLAMVLLYPWALAEGYSSKTLACDTAHIYEGVHLGGEASFLADRAYVDKT